MENIIKKAYENVEDINTFDENSYMEYKKERLKYQKNIVRYINTIKKEKIKLLDVGSGSSVLAYALSNIEILDNADCVELSESRYIFAEQWKKDNHQFFNVSNHNIDIQQFNFKSNYYNLITIIDNTFSYIGIYYQDTDILKLMNNIYNSLEKDGTLILEVSLFNNFIKQIDASNSGVVQKFEVKRNIGLWEYKLINNNIMNIKSTYISNECIMKNKEENSKIYSFQELSNLLEKVGFSNPKVYSDFHENKYEELLSETLVLVAKK